MSGEYIDRIHGWRPATSCTSRPPRILLIVENVALARDHRLRKQARSLVESGFDVSVICRSDPHNREHPEVRVHEYRALPDAQSRLGFVREYGYSWAMAAWLTLKLFVTEPFDAVQISGTPDIYFTIGAPFKLLGKPLVLDQRDLSPELYEVRYGRRGRLYDVLRWFERGSFRTADHVITVNSSLENVVYRRGALPSGAVTVVGNGPLLEHTSNRRPRPELKMGRRFLCCWVGMMGPQDRVDVGLRAVHHLVHVIGRTDCHFSFIGDGETRDASKRLAVELGVGDWVSFPGWLREEDAFGYLSTADIGLEPNLEEIVSPVKGMEYMAFSVPFVAFDLIETRALAEGAAAYAKPGDVASLAGLIDDLLADPVRRAAMGRTGRRLVEDHIAWDRQKAAYVGVYRRLLGTSIAPPARPSHGHSEEAAPMTAQASVSTLRRARHRVRMHASEHPRLYLPFARYKYPGPSPEVIGAQTRLVIEGYTRSAMTFAVYALQLAQDEPVRLAHHLHAPAQLIEAVRRGIPALVLIREPQGAILSQVVREPDVALADALLAYSRYYARVSPYRAGFVIADFQEVTQDFGSVTRRLNARFGTSYQEFVHTEENVQECLSLIKHRGTLSRTLLGFESGVVGRPELQRELERLASRPKPPDTKEAWVPSTDRERAKAELREQWLSPGIAPLRERAQRTYLTFCAS